MRIALLLFFLGFSITGWTQSVKGVVTDASGKPLAFASVYWVDKSAGVQTDTNGFFSLAADFSGQKLLVVRYLGFENDTIPANPGDRLSVAMTPVTILEVQVKGERNDSYIDGLEAAKVEVITTGELRKAACCDLAGCFNTTGTVQPTTTNVLTNAKELRILGLAGVYNQILFDGLPLLRGLHYTYGVSAIPGPLVGNIYVSKGSNSVLQGFSSISGQINVLPKNPSETDALLLNAYVNSFGESQYNAVIAHPIGERQEWHNLLSVHMVQPAADRDKDEDTFLDLPKLQRYHIFDKLTYRDPASWGWFSEIGVGLLWEERVGGQVGYDPARDAGSSDSYGQQVRMVQPTVYQKSGYRFSDDRAITIQTALSAQDQDAWYGETRYLAQQWIGYANLQLEQNWGNHALKTGLSYRYYDLIEHISFSNNPLNKSFAGRYQQREHIPGVFAENTFRWWDDRITWIVGMRYDWHDQYGGQFAPRSLLKLDFSSTTSLRATAGYGWRTVNIFPENNNLLFTQRDVQFLEPLRPEQSLTLGLNLMQRIIHDKVSGYVSADVFQTRFNNQVFPDYHTDPMQALIYNFSGISLSRGMQVDVNTTWADVLTVKSTYSFLDVYQEREKGREYLPFVPRHKVLTSVSYQPASERWQFDVNHHWYGEQVVPPLTALAADVSAPDAPQSFSTWNLQFTYSWNKWEVYGGVENLFDFRQERPFVSWEDPFSPYFDITSAWGPTRGRELYLGIRFVIPEWGKSDS